MNHPARRVEPTRSLLQGVPYVPAHRTQTDGVLARWLETRKPYEPTLADWQDYDQWVKEEV